jgi:hypothetical protein
MNFEQKNAQVLSISSEPLFQRRLLFRSQPLIKVPLNQIKWWRDHILPFVQRKHGGLTEYGSAVPAHSLA